MTEMNTNITQMGPKSNLAKWLNFKVSWHHYISIHLYMVYKSVYHEKLQFRSNLVLWTCLFMCLLPFSNDNGGDDDDNDDYDDDHVFI